jgi:hypothetical protein
MNGATKIHQLKVKSRDTERQFHIGAHFDQLREKIREFGDVRLLIVDPLTAYLGDVDSNPDPDPNSPPTQAKKSERSVVEMRSRGTR